MKVRDPILALAACAVLGWFFVPHPSLVAAPGVSIRGVVVGTPAEEVLATLGKPLATGNDNDKQNSYMYPAVVPEGVPLNIVWGKKSGLVEQIQGPDLTVNGKSLPRGSSLDDILAVLGSPDQLLENRPSAYLVYHKYNMCIRFVSHKGIGLDGAAYYEMRSDLDDYMHWGKPFGEAEFRRDYRVNRFQG